MALKITFATAVKLRHILKPLLLNIILCTTAIFSAEVSTPVELNNNIAQQLHWKTTEDKENLCQGYYDEPKIVSEYPHPAPSKDEATQITAQGPTYLASQGWSVLTKNVVVSQEGRLILADKAYLLHDAKTSKIKMIKLVGNVQLMEHGKLIVTPEATLNPDTHEMTFNHALYHVSEKTLEQTTINAKFIYDAWGTARYVYRDQNEIMHLYEANYTTCSPTHPSWVLSARKLTLNKHIGRGTASNAWLSLHHIPLLYTPYFSFPIDNTRHTGFLMPTFSHSSEDGYDVGFPFYWNMAPNYDMTITPEVMTNRGFQFDTLFRYLTENNEGSFNLTALPYDAQFQKFRKSTLDNLNPAIPPEYVTALKSASDARGFFSFNDESAFNPEWSGHLVINLVSDPYYFADLFPLNMSSVGGFTPDQLLNQADVDYEGSHWQGTAFVQAYQTLHNINYAFSNTDFSQYMRAPQLDFTSEYPDLLGGLDFSLNGQNVNFLYHSLYVPLTQQQPVGDRLHLQPAISKTFSFPEGYLRPAVALDDTSYQVAVPANPALLNGPRPELSASRNLPIVNVDSGLYLQNLFQIGSNQYIQTFEPRLSYLYVPYLNQNKYPNFDTILLPFSFDQLFSLNAFTGFDRIENANQFTLALTSRLLDPITNDSHMDASVGLAYYMDNPRVKLYDQPMNQPLPNSVTSPLIGEITFYPWNHWAASGSMAWDFEHHQMDNDDATLSYMGDENKTASVGYQYLNTTLNPVAFNFIGPVQPSEFVHVGASWPLNERWSALGYWYYNIADNRSQAYYGGIEYSTCCWAIRFIANRTWLGPSTTTNGSNQFTTTYVVQLLLKGLGSIGNSDPGTLLTSTLPGYQDSFKNF